MSQVPQEEQDYDDHDDYADDAHFNHSEGTYDIPPVCAGSTPEYDAR
jgi:hypothetical protein